MLKNKCRRTKFEILIFTPSKLGRGYNPRFAKGDTEYTAVIFYSLRAVKCAGNTLMRVYNYRFASDVINCRIDLQYTAGLACDTSVNTVRTCARTRGELVFPRKYRLRPAMALFTITDIKLPFSPTPLPDSGKQRQAATYTLWWGDVTLPSTHW